MATHARVLVGSYLKALFLYVLGVLLPLRMKRIIFLTTVHLQLVRDGIFRDETLDKLNRAMNLANHDDALLLPARLSTTVWTGHVLSDTVHAVVPGNAVDICLVYEDARRLSESIISITPKWLQYGGVEDMANDLIRMFYCQASMPKALAMH